MKSEEIKRLLEIILDKPEHFQGGLCLWTVRLQVNECITYDEYRLLYDYIKDNKPFWSYFRASPYWWKVGKINPRIRWIKKHIKRNS